MRPQGWAQPARPASPYLQEAFAAQKESEAKLRPFLADASHELRTPLTSIQGFAELFRLGVANEHVDTDAIMRRIEEESKRMRVLVDDLLLLARFDERRDIEPSRVDLAVLAPTRTAMRSPLIPIGTSPSMLRSPGRWTACRITYARRFANLVSTRSHVHRRARRSR